MNYQQLIEKLFSVNLHGGMKLGLKNSLRLQELLNYPDRNYKTIHVAGTNGKGSVTTKIASALQQAGYRVGLYTSPHLSCFRERVRINGEMIGEESVTSILNILFKLVEQEQIPATFFEITTFLAFVYFQQEEVDVAVLETGLGGRLDATNIVNPLLSVITSISLDHTEILGKTIAEITKEKGGIIKPQVPVVIGPQVPFSIVNEIAQLNGSLCIQMQEKCHTFEEENRQIAKRSLEFLKNHFLLDDRSIANGLDAKQPCRFEIFSTTCPIILDVAHNPDGLIHFFKSIRYHFGNRSLRILFGLSKNKDITGCLEIIRSECQHFHIVEAENGRGAPSHVLLNGLLNLGVNRNLLFSGNNIENEMQTAIQAATEQNQILVVCGTFFIMAQVRTFLGLEEPRDFIDMNERDKRIIRPLHNIQHKDTKARRHKE